LFYEEFSLKVFFFAECLKKGTLYYYIWLFYLQNEVIDLDIGDNKNHTFEQSRPLSIYPDNTDMSTQELLFQWASTINIQQILTIILTCLPRNCCFKTNTLTQYLLDIYCACSLKQQFLGRHVSTENNTDMSTQELLFQWASTINIQQILRIILTCLPRNCCFSEQPQ
jgi:hypothetical protein